MAFYRKAFKITEEVKKRIEDKKKQRKVIKEHKEVFTVSKEKVIATWITHRGVSISVDKQEHVVQSTLNTTIIFSGVINQLKEMARN